MHRFSHFPKDFRGLQGKLHRGENRTSAIQFGKDNIHRANPDTTTKKARDAVLQKRASGHNKDRPTEIIAETVL